MSRNLSSVLRPYLHSSVKPRQKDVYLRFYTAAAEAHGGPTVAQTKKGVDSLWSSTSYKNRLKQLTALHPEGQNAPLDSLYPRVSRDQHLSPLEFTKLADPTVLNPGDWSREQTFKVAGKIQRIRQMGRSLFFIDVVDNENKVQVMLNLEHVKKRGSHSTVELDDLRKRIGVGDHYAFSGIPHRTARGELTLGVQEYPQLLAPSLQPLPAIVTDKETLARLPQLDLTLQRRRRDLLRLRHVVERAISNYLEFAEFTKVTTPILAADTGGAAAQPFETATNEIHNVPLRLRISPELALKKLIAAGMGPVYEIGPSFRNEGLDSTHNPEFTTCEFYKPYASLDTLMSMTEALLMQVAKSCNAAISTRLKSLDKQEFTKLYFLRSNYQFKRLPFLPVLLELIQEILPTYRLPRQFDETTVPELIELFQQLQQKAPERGIKIPSNPTTARLLDTLCSHFIEPLCEKPTFIVEHPAIMSPLAKSFRDPKTGLTVSARAELFINGVEYANLYEEENDPFLQAKKFLQQSRGTAELKNALGVDRSHEEVKRRLTPGQQYYVRILEMGLPATGGWGCGIERLVMLFGGAERISEVLPFGGLRSVVAMGTAVDANGRLIVDKGGQKDDGADETAEVQATSQTGA